jgi:hypothetical protein
MGNHMTSIEIVTVLTAAGALVTGVILAFSKLKGQRVRSKCCGAEMEVSDDDDAAPNASRQGTDESIVHASPPLLSAAPPPLLRRTTKKP